MAGRIRYCAGRLRIRGLLRSTAHAHAYRLRFWDTPDDPGPARTAVWRKLVDVMDKVDEHAEFDPRRDYALTVSDGELTLEEREARRPRTADDVALDV